MWFTRSKFLLITSLVTVSLSILLLSSVITIPYLSAISIAILPTFFAKAAAFVVSLASTSYLFAKWIHSAPENETSKQKPIVPKNLIKVKAKDWKAARKYFNADMIEPKLDKKLNHLKNSFIKVNNELYAIKKKPALGAGGEGTIKIVQNQKGKNYIVKIEPRSLRGPKDEMVKVTTHLKLFKGEAQREYMKTRNDKLIPNKLYTIFEMKEGKDLWVQREKIFAYSPVKKLMLAIKCAQALKKLHDQQIVHGDVKPGNFVGTLKPRMNVELVDYNFSKFLGKNRKFKWGLPSGTEPFLAPELKVQQPDWMMIRGHSALNSRGMPKVKFRPASDIYALGIMFEGFLNLNMSFLDCSFMTGHFKEMRPDIDEVIATLYEHLKNIQSLDTEAQEMVEHYEKVSKKSKIKLK